MKKGASILTIVILVVLAYGCENPFDTRTPEPPTRSRGTFVTPLTPEAVIGNIRNAVIEQNLVNYSRCLADPARGGTFRYHADPAAANTRPELFANWGLDDENRYFAQLNAVLPADSIRTLTFTAQSITTVGDSAIFVQDYVLDVHHNQQALGIARLYAGQARYTLRRDNLGEWAIHRWADLSTGTTPTWSELKGSFGQ